MDRVYARAPESSSVWVGRPANAGGHNEGQALPMCTIPTHACGLQNGCRTGFRRRGSIAISLEITGGRTWIRTTDLFLIRQAQ
jgi:hypothetical protein